MGGEVSKKIYEGVAVSNTNRELVNLRFFLDYANYWIIKVLEPSNKQKVICASFKL